MKGFPNYRAMVALTVVLLTIFTIVVVVPNVRMVRQVYSKAAPANVYLPYVSYDELPYQPEEIRGLTRGPGDKFFEDGIACYQRKDYPGAARGLTLAVRHAPDRAHWWLYLGVSYFLQHQGKPAIEALKHADFLAHNELKIQARWYLAQSYLLDAKPTQALPLLAWIAEQKANYAPVADSLRTRLQFAVK
jgi:hypothetical protein